MSKRLEAYLVIGCGGFETTSSFLLCNSISTPILDFEEIEEAKYERVMMFMERTCKLFDKPTYDYNKVVNIITMLYRTYEVLDQERLVEIQRYLKMHRDCGIFLILLMKEDFHARQ